MARTYDLDSELSRRQGARREEDGLAALVRRSPRVRNGENRRGCGCGVTAQRQRPAPGRGSARDNRQSGRIAVTVAVSLSQHSEPGAMGREPVAQSTTYALREARAHAAQPLPA